MCHLSSVSPSPCKVMLCIRGKYSVAAHHLCLIDNREGNPGYVIVKFVVRPRRSCVLSHTLKVDWGLDSLHVAAA